MGRTARCGEYGNNSRQVHVGVVFGQRLLVSLLLMLLLPALRLKRVAVAQGFELGERDASYRRIAVAYSWSIPRAGRVEAPPSARPVSLPNHSG